MDKDPVQPENALAVLDEHERRGDVNVLRPVISIEGDAVSPYLVASVQIITIVPKVDTYNDPRYANERSNKHALSALGLTKIANAAGIKWVPELNGVEERERRPDGHVYIRFRAGAAIRQPNGEWHVELATKEVDTADYEDRRRAELERQNKSANELESTLRRDVLAFREHALSHAETKAKNRVIRRILALRQVYTTSELKRPFAVPRLLYQPSIAEDRERVMLEGKSAAGALFGKAELSAGEIGGSAGERLEREGAGSPGTGAEVEEQGASTSAAAEPVKAEVVNEPPPPSDEDAPPDERPTQEPQEPQEPRGPKPAVDPALPNGKRFSELAGSEEGRAELKSIAEKSRAKARKDAAAGWLRYGGGE